MKKFLILLACLLILATFIACDASTVPAGGEGDGVSQTTAGGATTVVGGTDTSTGDGVGEDRVAVYFVANGGVLDGMEQVIIENGAQIPVLSVPDVSRDGYAFLGWAYDTQGFAFWSTSDVFLSDTALYAVWRIEAGTTDTSNSTTDTSKPGNAEGETVTVIFRANGGVLDFDRAEIGKGEKLPYSKVPSATKSGYTLKGWGFDPQGTELWSARNHTFTEAETVLYAIWEKDSSGTTDTTNPGTTDTSKPGSTATTKPSTTDTTKPATTDTSKKPGTTDTTKPGTTSSTTKPTTPVIVPDRTQYKADVVGDKEAIYYINDLVRHPVLTPYYNGYKAALTMTFDDGYHAETGINITNQYEKFGFRGTMMLGVCFIKDESMIKAWSAVFARGYLDLGCHAYNHMAPSQMSSSDFEHEIKDAIMFLREKFPGQRVLTFATPLAQITNAYEEYLSQFVIGNRLEAGGTTVNLTTNLDYNPYRVKAVSFNVRTNMSGLRTEVEVAVKNGSWIVELCHCVKENADGVDVELSVFQNHCEWLYRNYRDLLWVTTFEDVLVYGEQLKHTAVDYTACDRESMTFTVTPDGTLDKDLYKIPMTIMVYLPDFVDSAYATVNGVYQPLEITSSPTTGERIVYVREISATEVSEVKVYLGANKTMKNNCVHSYFKADVVEPTHEAGGYTVNECSKCGHTYNSAYTNPVHDYTGREEVVIEAVLTQRGLKKVYCTQCDKHIVEEIRYVEE